MDELEFRRRAITHPSDRDPAFLKAAEASPANRKHLDEMQQLERQVRSTLEVDVPAGLAERILLRQAMAAEEEQVVPLPVTPARTQWRALAIAASVAFLLGMSTRWISWPVAPDTLIPQGVLVEVDKIELLSLKAAGILPPQYGDEPRLGSLVVQQGIYRLPGAQESLLHQIVGDLRIPAQPVGVAVDVPVQGVHQGFVLGLFVCHLPIDRRSAGILSRVGPFSSEKT